MAISKERVVGYKLATKHGNSVDFIDFIKSLNVTHKTLVMDNVALKDFVQSIHSNILYTPPYSPQYNPIELAFSTIKSAYRKLRAKYTF